MVVNIQKKINLAFIVLGCSLPLLSASPSNAQTCTEAEIQANIENFQAVNRLYDPPFGNVIQCQKEAVQPLIVTVLDQNSTSKVRRIAAFALSLIKESSPAAIQPLIKVVENQQDDLEVRRNVAFTLRTIAKDSPETIAVFIDVLKDQQDNLEIRSHAATALTEMGHNSSEVVDVLVNVVKNQQSHLELRSYVATLLEAISFNLIVEKGQIPKHKLNQLIQALKPVLEIQDEDLLLPPTLRTNINTLQASLQKKI
ncbi:MAG: HEAT repeat domain-containing protein [Limnoraphis sp.]